MSVNTNFYLPHPYGLPSPFEISELTWKKVLVLLKQGLRGRNSVNYFFFKNIISLNLFLNQLPIQEESIFLEDILYISRRFHNWSWNYNILKVMLIIMVLFLSNLTDMCQQTVSRLYDLVPYDNRSLVIITILYESNAAVILNIWTVMPNLDWKLVPCEWNGFTPFSHPLQFRKRYWLHTVTVETKRTHTGFFSRRKHR